MAAAAAAAAAALGLGDEEDEGSNASQGASEAGTDPAGWEEVSELDEDDPPLDEEAIGELKTEFRSSLVRVFDYTEQAAQVLQDLLHLNEPVDLLQAWGSDSALEYACNNLIRSAHHMVPVPAFRYSMSQDLILYRNWVNLRISRGLGTEAVDFKRKERTFMYNWQRALTDIKESVRLASKSESEVIKFNAKDWLKWYKSIDNHFRRTLGVRGVTLDWVYREQAEPKPGTKYPSIAAELKATLILSGNHFEEDSASVYAVVATSTFDTTAYSYVSQFENTRNGRDVMLALKLQFGGKAYVVSRSKDANSIVRTAQFSGPTRQYTYDQHVARFNDAYNELALIGEPIQEHVKVQLFCDSLQEEIMSQSKMQVQLAPATARNFTKATGMLKSMRNMLVSDKAKKGVDRYVAELGITPKRKSGGGGGGGKHPGKRKKKGSGGGAGGAGGTLQLHGYSDEEWRALPDTVKTKVQQGRAAEKAAKRAASAASSAKPEEDKEADKGGVKFGKGAHA
jgi:hypothetical protein